MWDTNPICNQFDNSKTFNRAAIRWLYDGARALNQENDYTYTLIAHTNILIKYSAKTIYIYIILRLNVCSLFVSSRGKCDFRRTCGFSSSYSLLISKHTSTTKFKTNVNTIIVHRNTCTILVKNFYFLNYFVSFVCGTYT